MSRPLSPVQSAQNGSNGSSIDVEITQPDEPSTFTPKTHKKTPYEITEEDLFRIKELRNQTVGSELNELSNISVADSKSNFDEHVSNVDSEWKGEDEKDVDQDAMEDEEAIDEEEEEAEQFTIYGNFAFGRRRRPDPELPHTVTVLNYPFDPLQIPEGVDAEEYKQHFTDSKVYLVGTAHFSNESQQDVLKTICFTQPDVVMVELCPSRISILSMDEESLLREAKSLNREKIISTIKQSGLVQGILHVLLLSTSAHITRELGMAPGGEFRAAHMGSLNVKHCQLVLGDRPIQITLQRALNSLGFFQKMRLFYHIILSNGTSITQEEVERCKNKDLLEELLKEMAGEFPQLSRIFVEERDQYMTHVLHTLLKKTTEEKIKAAHKVGVKYQPVNVVAVVGIGHVPGIVSNWNKPQDAQDLLTIPPPPKSARIVSYAIKLSIYGLLAYGVYRVGKFTYTTVKSSFS